MVIKVPSNSKDGSMIARKHCLSEDLKSFLQRHGDGLYPELFSENMGAAPTMVRVLRCRRVSLYL